MEINLTADLAEKAIGTKCELTAEEIATVKKFARAVFEANREAGIEDRRMNKAKNPLELLEHGFLGQFAFQTMFGCLTEEFWENRPRRMRDDHGDFVIEGRIGDVKTIHPGKRLLNPAWKAEKAEITVFAVMVGDESEFTFAGFFPAAELHRPERIDDLGFGPSYAADPKEFVEWKEIRSAIPLIGV